MRHEVRTVNWNRSSVAYIDAKGSTANFTYAAKVITWYELTRALLIRSTWNLNEISEA